MFMPHSTRHYCTVLLVAMATAAVSGTTYTFAPSFGSSGDWSSPTNWSPNGTPDADDIAIIPTGKTCYVENSNQEVHELRIENGATVGLRSKNLTFKNVSSTQPLLKIDGTLFLDDTSSSTPQILIDASSLTVGSLAGSYTGIINARVTDGYGVGRIQPTGSTGDVDLVVDRATFRGSIQFYCSSTRRLSISLESTNSNLEVDHASDLMEIGEMSDTPDRLLFDTTYPNSAGDVTVTAGHCRFGKAQLSSTYNGTLDLSGGTLTLSEYYVGSGSGCFLNLTGGTFRVDGLAQGNGGFWLGSGSRIEVDPAAAIDWEQ